ncbi:bromodomain-containing protein 7 isoform X2 [Agrilus planipennis]|uniref:Bromodomain-containing protein 7 isoform X2 n=1 Tax=Agrilus planipennis TaxID=224129 RepID=A0A1W4WCB4_AGRPL|nr:bromodomain-containing protein 7 isoform X2 [Agrilus planipennis]
MGKHKKHKLDKRDRCDADPDGKGPGLKLILKVGNQTTPEHLMDWTSEGTATNIDAVAETYDVSNEGAQQQVDTLMLHRLHHKKSKKKKRKKEKSKDKDRERKHKHHHKEKKRKHTESSQDEGSLSLEEGCINNVASPSGREPRMCVLRKREERTALQRASEHVLKALEKRDPQQFFAWPVTDNIAPGYSAIISQPMDFNTMRQKIDENHYLTLQDFIADFKLVCNNAMQYNHVETIYYKAAKKLLHTGMKLLQPEKLGWLLNLIPELSSKDLGFEITPELRQDQKDGAQRERERDGDEGGDGENDHDGFETKKRMPATKFEAIPDCMSPEAILQQVQTAAQNAKAKLASKNGRCLGFLSMKKDGTTHLNILCGGDGVIPGTKKRPVLLGQLTGKVTDGTSHIQGYREDRRNVAKPVKPLYYGAFGSYAPSYDSAFANLTKEESDLVYQTYGSETAVQYAESILDFAKDCDYTLQMVDSLLDLLTGGDHTKTKKVLDEKRSIREEEEAVKTVLETSRSCVSDLKNNDPPQSEIDFKQLRTLSSLGIDTSFLEEFEREQWSMEEWKEMQKRLDTTSQLLDKLQKTQYRRLSAPPPLHLNNVALPTEEEVALAESVTDNLTEIAKRVGPGDVCSIQGIRKALGVNLPDTAHEPTHSTTANEVADLETELRQFLENESHLTQSPLRDDDKTIEEILME